MSTNFNKDPRFMPESNRIYESLKNYILTGDLREPEAKK